MTETNGSKTGAIHVSLGVMQLIALIGAGAAVYDSNSRFRYETISSLSRSEEAIKRYIPIIDNIVHTHITLTSKVDELTLRLTELNKVVSEHSIQINANTQDIAVIKGNDGRIRPR